MTSAAASSFAEVFFWFAGLAVVLVWTVFRDTSIDYRLVMGGAVLPDLLDGIRGGPREAHTLAFSVGLLLAVMVGTTGRRLLRRRLLALPVASFCHLLLDGTWMLTTTFWWPAFGTRLQTRGLPSLQRPVALVVVQEVAGLVALAWWWRRFRLGEPERRRYFVHTGRLGRDLLDGPAPA